MDNEDRAVPTVYKGLTRSIFQSKKILKGVWTGEGTGWVVISFLAGSGLGLRGGEGG